MQAKCKERSTKWHYTFNQQIKRCNLIFSGGDPLDIHLVHGISHTEVFNSAWAGVDAVNMCPEIDIKYPTDAEAQHKIAQGFVKHSKPGFKCCTWSIDGMLLWIEKPMEEECEKAKCGRKKCFCGRKHKFGLNLQAICDAECQFLDIDIGHPGATSDYLAFATSSFHGKLENGLLAEGLCIFGDNAYVNRSYMATPFKAVSSGSKDDYNFYHSQLRIKIECAFGMLVNRWGILRSPLSSRFTLQKIGSLLICLCRLHNFCINQRLKRSGALDSDDILPPTENDEFQIAAAGGVPLEPSSRDPDLNDQSPEQLLHGGEHFDDVHRNTRRRLERADNREGTPRDAMVAIVERSQMKRPVPNQWRRKP